MKTLIAPEPRISRIATIVSIEDDLQTQEILKLAFREPDYILLAASNLNEGLELARRSQSDVILLDLGLPDASGVDNIAQICQQTKIPILVLSATADEATKVKALRAGAEGYVTKPFGIEELKARVRVALRHSVMAADSEPALKYGDLRLDPATREVKVRGESVATTPLEFSLLWLLLRHAGKIVTHRQILSEVWGDEYVAEAQYLRVYIGYLRRKIEIDPSKPRILLTEPRVGYRLSQG
jgi:two-component system KDP operon response regulator KdpE